MKCKFFCNIGKDSNLKKYVKGLVRFEVDEKIVFFELIHEVVFHIGDSLHSVEDGIDDLVSLIEDYQIFFAWFYDYFTLFSEFIDEHIDFQLLNISSFIIYQQKVGLKL